MQMNNKNQTTDNIVEEIIEEFNFFDDWEDKYAHIIDMGKKLEKMDNELMVEDTKLRGCQSTVYFHSQKENNEKIHFRACSDAAIVQGLIALLLRVYNNRRSIEILNISPDFISKIGLNEHLSVTRKNGLSSMINAIKSAAKH
jgi:cysteine desulfuration protein SufE